MSKLDLLSRGWCDLIFEGKNQQYGAYRIRANAGRRQLRAVIIILIVVAVIAVLFILNQVVQSTRTEDKFTEVTQMSKLKQEKKPEKKQEKIEVKYEKPQEQKVAVKASIQFTAPVIKSDDQVDKNSELKTMDELMNTKAAIASATYKGDIGGTVNIDDLKENQSAGGKGGGGEEGGGDGVFTVVEQPPTFPGGENALIAYIAKHLKYPQVALEQEIQGVVKLRFVVMPDGTVGDVVIQQGLESHCDKEAVRVVKSLPRFIPGKQQGKPVAVWYTLPIRFVIM